MIYLLRHGQTEMNAEGRLQGQSDSPLTVRGRGQAAAMGDLLATVIEDPVGAAWVCSPLGRARHTAEIVAARMAVDPARIGLEPRLTEIGFGRWEGLTRAEIEDREPALWQARLADKWDFVIPGGESYAMVAARARAWLGEQRPDAPVVAVCHGAFGRILRGLYLGASAEEIFALDEPQDALFRLTDGVVQRFDVERA
jgi:broad specificity phosphatase PhoE